MVALAQEFKASLDNIDRPPDQKQNKTKSSLKFALQIIQI
jgi:hypothetical protein